MNSYPKVFNIDSDPREEHNIGTQYEWVIGPTLKVVEEIQGQRSAQSEPTGSEHHALLTSGHQVRQFMAQGR
jgi:arylsulfatase